MHGHIEVSLVFISRIRLIDVQNGIGKLKRILEGTSSEVCVFLVYVCLWTLCSTSGWKFGDKKKNERCVLTCLFSFGGCSLSQQKNT